MKHLVLTLSLVSVCAFAAERTAVTIPTQPTQFINQHALEMVTVEPSQSPTIRLEDRWVDPLAPTVNAVTESILSAARREIQDELRIVQFNGALTPEIADALATRGLRVVGAVPHNAYIIMVPANQQLALAEIPSVRWTGNYAPQFRVGAKLRRARSLRERTDGADAAIRVQAAFLPDANVAQIKAALEAYGEIENVVRLPDLTVVTMVVPLDQVDAVSRSEWLVSLEYAPRARVMNNIGTDVIDVRNMWNLRGLTGKGEIVAVADDGLDIGTISKGLHTDFKDGYGAPRVVGLQDYLGDGAADNLVGHGTHVSGTVLGNGALSGSDPTNNVYPPTCYAGAAPRAELHFQALGSNNPAVAGIVYPPADLGDLFRPAYTNGARIHQDSWGYLAYGDYDTRCRQLDVFAFNHPDMLIVYAVGNAGVDSDSNGVIDSVSAGSPGTAKNTLTVGDTENNRPSEFGTWGALWPASYPVNPIKDDPIANRTNGMAAFSSRGPCGDGRYKPDIVAPGTYVASTRTHAIPLATPILWGQGTLLAGDSNYVFSGGSSMSAPFVSGAAALLREEFRLNRGYPNPSAPLMRAVLVNGARDVSPGQYLSPQEIPMAPNGVEGWGRCELHSTLYGPPNYALQWDTNTFGPAGTWTKSVTVYDTNMPFKVHLAWNDMQGSPFSLDQTVSYLAGGGILNDLDLCVIGPKGQTNYPTGMNPRLDTYYYTNTTATGYNSPAGMFEAQKCTTPGVPVTISRIFHVMYDTTGAGGQYGVAMWLEGAGGLPGTRLFVFTNTVPAGSPGFKYFLDSFPPGITITGQHYFVGKQLLASNLINLRDSGIGLYGTPRTYSDWTGPFTQDFDPDMWIHAMGTCATGDHINTVEGVIIPQPMAGTYTICVQGVNIPYLPVNWGLAYSGGLVPEPCAVFATVFVLLWSARRK